MACAKSIQIRQYPLSSEYLTVHAPIPCNGFMIENLTGNAFTICTDTSDSLTEKPVAANGWFGITGMQLQGNSRWSPPDVMFYAKGTGTLVVTFIS